MKKSILTKVLALLIMVMLLLSMFPLGAFAESVDTNDELISEDEIVQEIDESSEAEEPTEDTVESEVIPEDEEQEDNTEVESITGETVNESQSEKSTIETLKDQSIEDRKESKAVSSAKTIVFYEPVITKGEEYKYDKDSGFYNGIEKITFPTDTIFDSELDKSSVQVFVNDTSPIESDYYYLDNTNIIFKGKEYFVNKYQGKPSGTFKIKCSVDSETIGKGQSDELLLKLDNQGPDISDFTYKCIDEKGKYSDYTGWTNKSVEVSFEVSDDVGIHEVKVNDKVLPVDLGGKYKFTIENYAKLDEYNIIATDKFENKSSKATTEVKIDKNPPTITKKLEVIGGWPIEWNKKIIYFGGTGIKFSVSDKVNDDEYSDIGKIGIKTPLSTSYEYGVVEYNSEDGTCTYKFSVQFPFHTLGLYNFIIFDNAGNYVTTDEIEIGDDTQAPKIDSIKFESCLNTKDEILKYITFGVYNPKPKIKMIVNYKDMFENKYASGFSDDGISITSGDKNIIVEPYGTTTQKQTEDGYLGTATVIISENKSSEEFDTNFDISQICIKAKDKLGNESDEMSLPKLAEYINVGIDGMKFDSNFKLVASNKKPTISEERITSTGEHVKIGSENWFSGDVVADMTVNGPEAAGLHSISVKLNKENINEYVTYNGDEPLPDQFTLFDQVPTGEKKNIDIQNVDLSIKMSSDGKDNTAKYKEGENTLIIEAISNTEKISDKKEITFYIDNTAPVVESIKFSDDPVKIFDETSKDIDNKDKNPADISDVKGIVDYPFGYFFKKDTLVTVNATDDVQDEGKIKGIGIKSYKLYKIDYLKDSKTGEISVGDPVEATKDTSGGLDNVFVIEKGFKGMIYAVVDDKLGNVKEDGYQPKDAIVTEDEDAHNEHSEATIEVKPQDGNIFKDIKGHDLYDGEVGLTFTVKDTHSGVGYIKYTISGSSNNGNVNEEGEINVPLIPDGEGQDDWNYTSKERNLVTEISKTIHISDKFNTNDIKVSLEAIDRAGYPIYAEPKVFSIDMTDPIVENPSCEPNRGNSFGGIEYFKDDRTVSFTIEERNFDKNQFIAQLNNAIIVEEGTKPSYVWDDGTCSVCGENIDKTQHKVSMTFTEGKYRINPVYAVDLAKRKSSLTSACNVFVVDKTNPVVEGITFDNNNSRNGNYYNAVRNATITVREHNFANDSGYYTCTPNSYKEDNTTSYAYPTNSQIRFSSSGDIHTATIPFNEDGKYSFTFKCRDRATRESNLYTVSFFYIDKKIDKIEISEVLNGVAYDKDVSAQAYYKDYNVANTTYEFVRTVFDSVKLKQLTGSAYNLVPSDTGNGGVERTVRYNSIPKKVLNDGVYSFKATIEDKAGNHDEKSVLFSVNRFGSTFIAADVPTATLLENGYTSNIQDVRIKEINVNTVTKQKADLSYNTKATKLQNGIDFQVSNSTPSPLVGAVASKWSEYIYNIYKTNFAKDGEYKVTLSSTDHFKKTVNNRTAYHDKNGSIRKTLNVNFVVDSKNPKILTTGVENGVPYKDAERTVTLICDDVNLDKNTFELYVNDNIVNKSEYTIEENASGLTAKYTIKATGTDTEYTVFARVKDKAGNEITSDNVKFMLSASFFTRFFHNTLAVVLTSVVLVLIIAGVVFLVLKKKRKI